MKLSIHANVVMQVKSTCKGHKANQIWSHNHSKGEVDKATLSTKKAGGDE